jgi:hypothetical protein
MERRLQALPPAPPVDLAAYQQDRLESQPQGKLESQPRPPAGQELGSQPSAGGDTDLKKAIGAYLQDNPGSGLPSGVQMGYSNGFYIRSTLNPDFKNWSDESRIPFEFRIRGRVQADYYYYKVTDQFNHLTNTALGVNSAADFSQFLIKRARLFFEGTMFDPNLRYNITLDGNTRGLAALAGGNGIVGQATTPGGNSLATVDHAVRLFNAFVAYDWHPVGTSKGCSDDCPDGSYRYALTITPFIGKVQPFFCLEEILGSGTEQFVEFSMADWFFDADDNNEQTGVGFQTRAFDDRLFTQVFIFNGNETQTANLQMQRMPGVQVGGWYDIGGTWDDQSKRWILFGDSISDIDYSCNPVLRVGAGTDLVPMDRRSQYSDANLNRVRVLPGAPGGSPILNVLNGDARGTANSAGITPFALDAVDSYTYDVFLAGKYRGFSLYNEWWLRNLTNFRGEKLAGAATGNPILYTSNLGGPRVTSAALFPGNIGIIDYGMSLQSGYFLVPKKLEIAGRWSWIRGESGDIDGRDTKFRLVNVPGVPGGPVKVIDGAFRNFAEVNEYAIGLNYYFYRQMVKWQTDFGVYRGGNPAQGGQSPAGFIPGVDGWMIRSQIQLQF